jgi:hypothetical protein
MARVNTTDPVTAYRTSINETFDAGPLLATARGVREGIVSESAYSVTAAGTGMTVSVAADQGMVNVQDDSDPNRIFAVRAHSAAVTLTVPTAHATLPRNDLVVLELLAGRSRYLVDVDGTDAQLRYIQGTATAGAAQTDALGVNGTPTLPTSAIPLAVVNVPATDTVITTSQIDDRRYRTSGKSFVATAESTSSTGSSVLLTTPDQVRNLVIPTGGGALRVFMNVDVKGSTANPILINLNVIDPTGAVLALASGNIAQTSFVGATLGANLTPVITQGSVWASGGVAGLAADLWFATPGVYSVQLRYRGNVTGPTTVTAQNRLLAATVVAPIA